MRRFKLFFFAVALTACTQEAGSPKADAPVTTAAEKSSPSSEQAGAEDEKEKLPDGGELLAAHVEASGGAAAIPKFESLHVEGEIAVESHNLKGTTKLWWQKDGKFYLEQYIEGIGMSRVGHDGETIWLEDPITGLRKLEGSEAVGYLQSSAMFLGHDWQGQFSAANTLGKQKLEDGKEVWEVELVSKGGPNLTIGLDADSKLIRYVKTMQPSLLGETPFEVRSDRYEAIEGYKFPMQKTIAISGLIELDETVTETQVNVPIDPAMFAFPSKRTVVPVDPKKQAPVEAPAKDAPPESGK